MTAEPSDMKPSDYVLRGSGLGIHGEGSWLPHETAHMLRRTLAYLDEQHAAGQGESDVIRAAKGVTLPDGRYEVVEISERDAAPALRVGDSFRATSVAAGSGGYWQVLTYDESAKRAASTWVTAVRRVKLPNPVAAPPAQPVPLPVFQRTAEQLGAKYPGEPVAHRTDLYQEQVASRFAAGESAASLQLAYGIDDGDLMGSLRDVLRRLLGDRREAAVPVAGGALPSNPVELETTRGQLQWGLDCVAGALGRPSLLVGEHAAAVAKVMSERDAALEQVEELTKERDDARSDYSGWLKNNAPRYVVDPLIQTSNELTKQRDAASAQIDELNAALERAHNESQALRSTHNPEAEQLRAELAASEVRTANAILGRDAVRQSVGQLVRERDEANERAARLEVELKRMTEAHDELAYSRPVESPLVATGERPIVVGSNWKDRGLGDVLRVVEADAHFVNAPGNIVCVDVNDDRSYWTASSLRKHCSHISDPPTPATGREGEQ